MWVVAPQDTEATTEEVPTLERLLYCDTRIEEYDDRAEREGYVTYLDAVGLPPLAVEGDGSAIPHEAYPHEDAEPPRYFAKMGLLARGGVSVTIRALHPPDEVLITWGRNGRASVTELAIPACDGAAWFAYPGGIETDEPRCVDLLITRGNETETARIAVGVPCPDPS